MDYVAERDIGIPMRDEDWLRAGVYRFVDATPRPVISRMPYDRTKAAFDVLKPMQCLAADSVYAVQDTATRFRLCFDGEHLVETGETLEYTVDGPLAWQSGKGHRLGTHVQSRNLPHLDRNLQTGGSVGEKPEGVTGTQRVYDKVDHPSRVMLPVVVS